MNCLSYRANSVRPRATVNFSRGTHESKQVTSNEEHESSKLRLIAATAANKKVIMIEAKVNALKSLCVVDTGASVTLLQSLPKVLGTLIHTYIHTRFIEYIHNICGSSTRVKKKFPKF